MSTDEPLLRQVLAHARRVRPEECVGLLGPHSVWPLRNVAAEPSDSFELDPLEVARALSAGFPVEGLYHSHPQGAVAGVPAPSARDVCLFLGSGWRYWIVDPSQGSCGCWRWTGVSFVPE